MTAASNTIEHTEAPAEMTTQQLQQRRKMLVEAYGDLVSKVAHRVLRKLPDGQTSVEHEDLVSIGILGLFDADRKYRAEAGQSFESFAEFRIRGSMLDELRKRDFFPRRLRAKANKLQKAEARLRLELGRDPSLEEIADSLDMTIEKLHSLKQAVQPYSFVEQSDPALQLRSGAPNPFDAVVELEQHQTLAEALSCLSDREQLVLDLYFRQELTQREIAGILDLTEGRISQIKSAALRKMRDIIARMD